MQNQILRFCLFFEPFLRLWLRSLQTELKLLAKIQIGYDKAQNSMLILNLLKKLQKSSPPKNVQAKTFCIQYANKSKKLQFSVTFFVDNFFRINLQFFLTDSKSASNSAEKNKSGYTNNDCGFYCLLIQIRIIRILSIRIVL